MDNSSDITTGQPEGVLGTRIAYRERLLPGIPAWLLVAFMTISLGVAYGYVYGNTFGTVLAAVSTLAIYAIMYFASPVVRVDELVLQVGDAAIPHKYIGKVQVLSKAETLHSRRVPAPRDAYLNLRSSIPESVLVTINDLTDPHPYWHFSSRNTQRLIAALESKTNA